MPVLFDFNLPFHDKPCISALGCVLKPSTAADFLSAFKNVAQFDSSTDCTGLLNTIASLQQTHARAKQDPWLNDTTRTARRECRKAEHRWQKDKLHVTLQLHVILKDSWRKYHYTVRAGKIYQRSSQATFPTLVFFLKPLTQSLMLLSPPLWKPHLICVIPFSAFLWTRSPPSELLLCPPPLTPLLISLALQFLTCLSQCHSKCLLMLLASSSPRPVPLIQFLPNFLRNSGGQLDQMSWE